MILHGNQRGGAKDLALHLLKDENDHVDVHDLRGFVANDLVSAFNEAYAVSRGTRAKQFLFSLSLNPPPSERVSTKSFEDAIARVEAKLGLTNQPRAIVFHEKDGRRHCHAVWSRTDTRAMKAIPLPHTKRKLMEISRDLFIEHGWNMPKGMITSQESDPRNFSLAQWQQAKRIGKDPRKIKQVFQDCWAISNNLERFSDALRSRGYVLAKGDRRNFVAVDHRCEIFAVPKWTGLKAKEIQAKLGKASSLLSVSEARIQIAKDMKQQLNDLSQQQTKAVQARQQKLNTEKKALRDQQRQARKTLIDSQQQRWEQETLARQSRYNQGLRGFWDRLTGRHKYIRTQNDREAARSLRRDQQEKDQMIFQQLERRQHLQKRLRQLGAAHEKRHQCLAEDIAQYQQVLDHKQELFDLRQSKQQYTPKLGPDMKLE